MVMMGTLVEHEKEVMAVLLSRRAALTALAVPFTATVAGCLDNAWDDLPATTLRVATGNRGGVFSTYGEALRTVLGRRLPGVRARTRHTNASVQNVRLMARGACDIGFSLGDTASDAVRGTGDFSAPIDVVALARTYDSFVHLVVRADDDISEVADLRGRRVGLGAPGSGTRVIAERVLRQAGLSPGDVEAASEPLEDSAAALRQRSLSAFFFVSGIPNQTVLALSHDLPLRLIELDAVVAGMGRTYGPEYVGGPIPASTYGLPGGVDTVSVKNYVLADRGLPVDVAYAVTRVMFEAQEEIDRLAPGVRQPNLAAAIFTSPVELHPGAVRYYRERQP